MDGVLRDGVPLRLQVRVQPARAAHADACMRHQRVVAGVILSAKRARVCERVQRATSVLRSVPSLRSLTRIGKS